MSLARKFLDGFFKLLFFGEWLMSRSAVLESRLRWGSVCGLSGRQFEGIFSLSILGRSVYRMMDVQKPQIAQINADFLFRYYFLYGLRLRLMLIYAGFPPSRE